MDRCGGPHNGVPRGSLSGVSDVIVGVVMGVVIKRVSSQVALVCLFRMLCIHTLHCFLLSHIHVHTRTHTYTHVHTRTHTHIHVHTRTHTYTPLLPSPKREGGKAGVPLSDRQAALSLLLELALQRAVLHRLLEVIVVLLQLAGGQVHVHVALL